MMDPVQKTTDAIEIGRFADGTPATLQLAGVGGGKAPASVQNFVASAELISAAVDTIQARTGQTITGGVVFISDEAPHVFGHIDVDELVTLGWRGELAWEAMGAGDDDDTWAFGDDAYTEDGANDADEDGEDGAVYAHLTIDEDSEGHRPMCLATISDGKFAHACSEDKGHDQDPFSPHYCKSTGRYWSCESAPFWARFVSGRLDSVSLLSGLLAGAMMTLLVLGMVHSLGH